MQYCATTRRSPILALDDKGLGKDSAINQMAKTRMRTRTTKNKVTCRSSPIGALKKVLDIKTDERLCHGIF